MEFLAEMHPMAVHFPIAFLLLYVIVELSGIFSKREFLQKTAYLLLICGVVMAVVSVLTGSQAETLASQLNGGERALYADAIESHEEYATFTLWLFTGILFIRTFIVIKKTINGSVRYILIPLVLLGCFCIYKTGEFGGRLVHEYGVGVKSGINHIHNIDGD